MTQPHPDDFGDFLLHSPQEHILFAQLQEQAQKNPVKPGEAFARMDATRTVDGRTEAVVKLFHMDLKQRRLTITETRDGVETARRVLIMQAGATPPVERAPTPPPPPGPPEHAFYRHPFYAADLWPEDPLRLWILRTAETEVARLSALPRRIRLFGARFQDVLMLGSPMAPDIAPGTAATLRALSARPTIDRAFVEGWFAGPEGHGTAWILEPCADGTFWYASCTFERRPGLLGVPTSPWTVLIGDERDELPPPVRALLSPPPDEAPIPLGAPLPPTPPEIGMFFGTFPPTEIVPDNADDIAQRVGQSYENKLYKEPLPEHESRVTVFRGRDWETWVIKGAPTMGQDDTIRAIAARGARPDAITYTRMGIVPVNGEVYRALLTDGEANGRRLTRAFLIAMSADGHLMGHQILKLDHGEVGQDGWIGVPPISEVTLFTLNAAEA